MDGLKRYYTKWNKPDRERQILYDLTCMWNLKHKQISEYNKKEARLTDIENKLVVIRVERGRGKGH